MFVFLVVLVIIYVLQNKTEHMNSSQGGYCEKCAGLEFGKCMDCWNCGSCDGKCMNGHMNGNELCKKWIHNDEFHRVAKLVNIPLWSPLRY